MVISAKKALRRGEGQGLYAARWALVFIALHAMAWAIFLGWLWLRGTP